MTPMPSGRPARSGSIRSLRIRGLPGSDVVGKLPGQVGNIGKRGCNVKLCIHLGPEIPWEPTMGASDADTPSITGSTETDVNYEHVECHRVQNAAFGFTLASTCNSTFLMSTAFDCIA